MRRNYQVIKQKLINIFMSFVIGYNCLLITELISLLTDRSFEIYLFHPIIIIGFFVYLIYPIILLFLKNKFSKTIFALTIISVCCIISSTLIPTIRSEDYSASSHTYIVTPGMEFIALMVVTLFLFSFSTQIVLSLLSSFSFFLNRNKKKNNSWCQFKKSSNATIELKRPELSNPKWLDKDGADTSKSLVGETLKLVVDCNDDMDDGAGVVFAIFDKDGNKVTELASVNDGGKAEVEWIYKYKHDAENPLSEKPKFTFKAKAKYCKEVESESVEIYSDLIITIIDSLSKTVGDLPLEITIGDSLEEVKTDTEGLFEKKDIAPGIAYVTVVMDTSYERPDSSDYTVSEDEKIIPVPAAIGKHTVSIEIGKKMVLRLTQNNQGLST